MTWCLDTKNFVTGNLQRKLKPIVKGSIYQKCIPFIINQMFHAYIFSHPKSLFSICKTLLTFCNYIFRLFPEIISSILLDSSRRERVLSLRDASDILRDAFSQTEAGINNSYEVLWIWFILFDFCVSLWS